MTMTIKWPEGGWSPSSLSGEGSLGARVWGAGSASATVPCSDCGTSGTSAGLSDAAREGWEYWTGITGTPNRFQYSR